MTRRLESLMTFATFAGADEIHPSIVWAKFKAMAEGARLASEKLWR